MQCELVCTQSQKSPVAFLKPYVGDRRSKSSMSISDSPVIRQLGARRLDANEFIEASSFKGNVLNSKCVQYEPVCTQSQKSPVAFLKPYVRDRRSKPRMSISDSPVIRRFGGRRQGDNEFIEASSF